MKEYYIPTTLLVSNEEQVVKLTSSCFLDHEAVSIINNPESFDEISIEFPELMILDFSDWELGFQILDILAEDPWLHHQSIITICNNHDVARRIEGNKSVNLIAAISRYEISSELPKILNVIRKNQRLLYQRSANIDFNQGLFGFYNIKNDLVEMECIVNMVCSFLYNSNRINWKTKNRLSTALMELMINAIEHGNCEIGFNQKREWLQTHHTIDELISIQLKDKKRANRVVGFEYEFHNNESHFIISDEGHGFDWQHFIDNTDKIDYSLENGRGIMMARSSLSNLEFNEAGNVVKCTIAHQKLTVNVLPAIINSDEIIDVKVDEILIGEAELNDIIYFIVEGLYEVSIGNRVISQLTPDDIFAGEMSLLLNGRRSATVKSLQEGKVIPINRNYFIKTVKKHPHYGFFLAKLVAERLNRLNHNYEKTAEELLSLKNKR